MSFKPIYILAEEAEERIVALYRKERGDAAEIFNTAIDACQNIILDMYDNAPVEVEPVKRGRWIPVAERLPENGSDVLGWRENFGIFPANYDHGRFFDCMFDRFADDVVAWMPLPEPYEEHSMEEFMQGQDPGDPEDGRL